MSRLSEPLQTSHHQSSNGFSSSHDSSSQPDITHVLLQVVVLARPGFVFALACGSIATVFPAKLETNMWRTLKVFIFIFSRFLSSCWLFSEFLMWMICSYLLQALWRSSLGLPCILAQKRWWNLMELASCPKSRKRCTLSAKEDSPKPVFMVFSRWWCSAELNTRLTLPNLRSLSRIRSDLL